MPGDERSSSFFGCGVDAVDDLRQEHVTGSSEKREMEEGMEVVLRVRRTMSRWRRLVSLGQAV